MRAFIFGHSHMWGLRGALSQTDEYPALQLILCGTAELPGSLVYDNFKTGRPSINAAILSALYRAGADPANDVLVSGVAGNHFNALGLLSDGAPFDFHIPDWPTLPATDVPILPYRAVCAMMTEELKEFEAFCRRLKALSYRRFVHLSPPPPIPDSEFIRSKLPPLPSGEVADISDPNLRLKLWTVQNVIVDKILAKHDGTLIRVPPASRDANGFLKREFWKDSVHANVNFHALQLKQIQAVLNDLQTVEVQ